MTVDAHRSGAVRWAAYFARAALAVAFLSAVADRFGLWGPPGTEGIAWGDIESYEAYVALLNWFLPSGLIPVAGWTATIAEVVIAVGLIVGWQLRWFALAAGVLLTTFAVTMFGRLVPSLRWTTPSCQQPVLRSCCSR